MKNMHEIGNELKTVRDEVRLHSHLFTMEVKDAFENLEKRLLDLERKSGFLIEAFGEFNEEFWVGNKNEINSMVEEYKKIKSTLN